MFTSIEIDFDVFKELTVRRSTPDVTENDVLRELFGLEPVTSTERQSVGTGNGSVGIPWSSKGVTLPHGTKLRAEYGGRSYPARIENGAIVYDSRSYKSPSAAANAVTGKSVNGWAFWECQPPGKNDWVQMSEFRNGRPEPLAPNPQRFNFWDSFLALAEGRDLYADQKTPTRDSLYVRKWRGGVMEGTIAYVINQHSSRVAFYTIRAEVYDELHAHKQEIEAAFGESLLWTRRESGLTSRIACDLNIGGYEDEANWEAIQTAMIDAMLRFENALSPYIANIESSQR